ncbi:hypothetical protein LIER_39003 [Lithospermum erythrorhizon]|uniref:Uncharacterized protein n=1 Tax=Lithospermum erythrorhizon TaxID=34254 RepID=A0AAV3QAL8_LITER
MVHLKPPANRTRKISLPSPSHPLLGCVEQNLQKLKSSKGALSISVCQQLNGLKTLCESLNDALHLPLGQLEFSKQCRSKWQEHVLDCSIELLDMCGEISECFSKFKEGVKELESSVRRRRSSEKSGHDDDHEVEAYMKSKKKLNKMVSKCLKDLKRGEKHYCSRVYKDVSSDHSGLNGSLMVNLLKGIQQISFTILGSCLSFIFPSKVASKSKLSGWSLVSKFLQERKVVSFEGNNEEVEVNQILRIDSSLVQIIQKNFNPLHLENMLRNMKTLEFDIEEIEKELDVVFRLLLKTRVSLLNIFNV